MSDAWLLVQFEEGYSNTTGGISTWTVELDYYHPVAVFKTREQLVEFLGDENVEWNGDTAMHTVYAFRGDIKHVETYYAIPVSFGKIIVY